MAFKTFVLPALAMAGYAAAQSSCTASGTMTISSQADATAIAGCSTYSGSIAIATDVTTGITLSGVQKITGDLIADNVIGLTSLEADSLATIGGTFTLINMTLLTSLTMPELTAVDIIEWITLPRLSGLSFNSGVSQATTVNIIDTELGSLEGLTLDTVSELTISNNGQLTSVELPIKNIDTGLAIEFNGQTMDVSFPNLEIAYNLTFRNVSSISMPGLSTLNSSVGFYGCTFENASFANLTTVGGSITFVGNNDLTNVTMDSLTTLTGALFFSDNEALQTINGFPMLKTIDGAIDISGNFTSVSLPALKEVIGAANLQSTQDISSTCTNFNNLHSSGTIQGKVTCTTTANPQSSGTPSGTSGGSSGTSTATGGAHSDLYARSAAVTGVLGLIAALLGML